MERLNSTDNAQQLKDALERLRQIGYAVGQPATTAQGHTLITVGGKMLTREEIFHLACLPPNGDNPA